MKSFNIGIQLYGLRNSMREDFEGTLRAVAEMGYEYVEFAGYFGRSATEIKEILDKYGLKCISVHQSLDFYYDDPEGAIDFLKTFGVKYSIIPWYKVEELAGTDKWETTALEFNKYASILHEHGMKLGYHNHDFEFRRVDGKFIHDYIFEAVPEEYIEPELDTCWLKYAGLDPSDKIYEYSGRVSIVHLKDFVCDRFGGGPVYDLIDSEGKELGGSRENVGFEFRPLGEGVQDFASILEACEQSGTETLIVEQDQTYGMTELEAARISREYLRNTFGI